MQTFTRDTCRRFARRGAAAAMLAGALGACATGPAPESLSATTALNQTQSSGPSRWELVRWQQPDGTLRDIPHGDNGQPIIFEFNSGIDAAQGTVSGTSGCNRFSGSYGKTDTGIRFDRVAGTRMACPPPRMELESALLKAMQTPFLTVGTQPSAGSTGRRSSGRRTLATCCSSSSARRGPARRARDAADSVEKVVYIDSQRVECTGVGRMTCYRWRESPDAPWQLWYGPIEGLDFEPGISYKLRVREYKVPNPPADASSIRWQLLSVESRTRATRGQPPGRTSSQCGLRLLTKSKAVTGASPLPCMGEGPGVRVGVSRCDNLDFVEAPALTPDPSPASGRGEQTSRYFSFVSNQNGPHCGPFCSISDSPSGPRRAARQRLTPAPATLGRCRSGRRHGTDLRLLRQLIHAPGADVSSVLIWTTSSSCSTPVDAFSRRPFMIVS